MKEMRRRANERQVAKKGRDGVNRIYHRRRRFLRLTQHHLIASDMIDRLIYWSRLDMFHFLVLLCFRYIFFSFALIPSMSLSAKKRAIRESSHCTSS